MLPHYFVKHINVRKQAIPDKLQGTVATYLSGRVLNNQIKKGLLLSLSVKKIKIGEYLASKDVVVSCTLFVLW